MKLGNINFPEPMVDALRDKTLIVFAGAGVSMGPPANLPDFKKLALEVAGGTGEEPKGDETIDRFLTRLKNRGTNVHRIAAEILGRNNPQPTRLHLDLLRLWPNEDSLRIVTTNFDELFEQGANQHGMTPRIFQAPALPTGSRFHGIVHIHGSVTEPEEMVLTTEDFGRAYLTESRGMGTPLPCRCLRHLHGPICRLQPQRHHYGLPDAIPAQRRYKQALCHDRRNQRQP